ncbi:helix-turn-helix domain-containing protein [Streptomyces sp. NPDC047028]|uniref:helix-turn-helix transcriptional regulator n=1 Tax=Streptomyces sp. NPDC047028 TaxID=3155793 RepID=UPI003406BB5C
MGHLLEPVGLGATDSDVYLYLLSHGQADPADIARSLALSTPTIRHSLQRLTAAALCNRLLGRPARYVAAPPEVALDALVLHQHQVLDELRARARELTVRRAPVADGSSPLLELVEGAEAVLRTLARLELGAREEVLIIDSPPYLNDGALNTNELQALTRGVRYRALYHAPVLALPDRLALLERYLSAGEQARSLPEVRMKMLIADRTEALIPLSFTGADASTRLLVRSSPLLDALLVTFDALWEKGAPLGGAHPAPSSATDTGSRDAPHPNQPGQSPRSPNSPQPLRPRDRDILRLLASGAKDRTIARALGITERTVVRRIHALMTTLNATTRFQAGVQAAHRGWLSPSPDSDR